MRCLITVLAVALMALSVPVSAQQIGDADAGEQKSTTCAGCHGKDGRSSNNPQYPILAGQYPDYLYRSLLAYKTGERENAIMKGIVANLSEEDMKDLAAYYAEQPSELSVLDR